MPKYGQSPHDTTRSIIRALAAFSCISAQPCPLAGFVPLLKDMLRITTSHVGQTLRIKADGRLVGVWVDELRTVLLREKPYDAIEVDITDVTFADDEGEQLLLWIHKIGGHFRRGGSFSDFLCKRLGIPTSGFQELHPTTAGQ